MRQIILSCLMCVLICINFSDVSSPKTIDTPLRQPVLSLLQTGLDSNTSKEGQEFSAKLIEDVFFASLILIPKNSTVYGTVLKTQKAGLIGKDAYVKLKITKIKTDDKTISLEENPMVIEVSPPDYNEKKDNFLTHLPSTIADSATSLVLGKYSGIADAGIWAISSSAGMAAGVISGLVFPDEGKSRGQSSAQRALDSTPLGTASTVVKKGSDFHFDPGQYICIFFDRKTVEYIRDNLENISFTEDTSSAN